MPPKQITSPHKVDRKKSTADDDFKKAEGLFKKSDPSALHFFHRAACRYADGLARRRNKHASKQLTKCNILQAGILFKTGKYSDAIDMFNTTYASVERSRASDRGQWLDLINKLRKEAETQLQDQKASAAIAKPKVTAAADDAKSDVKHAIDPLHQHIIDAYQKLQRCKKDGTHPDVVFDQYQELVNGLKQLPNEDFKWRYLRNVLIDLADWEFDNNQIAYALDEYKKAEKIHAKIANGYNNNDADALAHIKGQIAICNSKLGIALPVFRA